MRQKWRSGDPALERPRRADIFIYWNPGVSISLQVERSKNRQLQTDASPQRAKTCSSHVSHTGANELAL